MKVGSSKITPDVSETNENWLRSAGAVIHYWHEETRQEANGQERLRPVRPGRGGAGNRRAVSRWLGEAAGKGKYDRPKTSRLKRGFAQREPLA